MALTVVDPPCEGCAGHQIAEIDLICALGIRSCYNHMCPECMLLCLSMLIMGAQ